MAGCGTGGEDPLPAHPVRILPLSVAVAEVVIDLVARERIVALPEQAAVPSFSNIVDRIDGIPLISADAERIVAFRPDLVILASYAPEGLVTVLRRAGIAVRQAVAPHDLDGVEAMILSIGAWTGEESKAAALVGKLRSGIREVRALIPSGARSARVVSLQGFGTTAGSETSFDAWVSLAGARNLAAERGVRGFRALSVEDLFAWQPDVLVVGKDPGGGAGLKGRILADPLYAPLRNRQILEIPFNHLTCLSHYGVESVRDLVRGLHP
jgi:iron complex transport system substrate-binding protein